MVIQDEELLMILNNICQQHGKIEGRTIMKRFDPTSMETVTCKVFMNTGLFPEGEVSEEPPESEEYEITIVGIWGLDIKITDSSNNLIANGYYDKGWLTGFHRRDGERNSGAHMRSTILRLLVEGDFTMNERTSDEMEENNEDRM